MNNNIFTILGLNTGNINLLPKTPVEEIIQNIAIILTTLVGTVPLDRKLGLEVTALDEPISKAMMRLSIYVLETIQDYEPRVVVQEIDFVPDPNNALDGKLYPRVVIRILEDS